LAERADRAGHGFADGANGAVEFLDRIAELVAAHLGVRDSQFVVTGNGSCYVEQQDARCCIGEVRGGASRKAVLLGDEFEKPGKQRVGQRHSVRTSNPLASSCLARSSERRTHSASKGARSNFAVCDLTPFRISAAFRAMSSA